MALATITGTLADFKRGNLAERNPELVFTPSAPTTTIAGGFLLSAVPVTVIPNSSGVWSVRLEEFENMNFPVHYTLQIRLLDPVAGYIFIDFPDWKIFAPIGGGPLTSIITGPVGGGLIWTVPDDEIPEGAQPGDLMLNTTTDDLFRIS